MLDYSSCGIFGDVRFWNTCVPSGAFSSLDHISDIGWHRVNESYRIERPNGTGHNMMILTLSGQGHIQVANQKYTASSGTVAMIPKNTILTTRRKWRSFKSRVRNTRERRIKRKKKAGAPNVA